MKVVHMIVVTLVLTMLVSCSKINPVKRSIDHIYVYHCSESSTPSAEYNIDLKKKAFEILGRNAFNEMTGEFYNESPETKPLTPDSIDTFLKKVQELGLTDWNETYDNYSVKDGHQWGITISFSDGTKKEITGSNAYPETWDQLNEALKALTGENVLRVESDWLEIN